MIDFEYEVFAQPDYIHVTCLMVNTILELNEIKDTIVVDEWENKKAEA